MNAPDHERLGALGESEGASKIGLCLSHPIPAAFSHTKTLPLVTIRCETTRLRRPPLQVFRRRTIKSMGNGAGTAANANGLRVLIPPASPREFHIAVAWGLPLSMRAEEK